MNLVFILCFAFGLKQKLKCPVINRELELRTHRGGKKQERMMMNQAKVGMTGDTWECLERIGMTRRNIGMPGESWNDQEKCWNAWRELE